MKTIQVFCLAMVTGFTLVTACKKDVQDMVPAGDQLKSSSAIPGPSPVVNNYIDWREDFATANSLSRWNLYGTPQPQWVNNAFGRFGLFDNNGNLPTGNFAVSKAKVGSAGGYIVESEVYINITNVNGTTISPEIGITRYTNQPIDNGSPEAGISMRLMYIGGGVTSVPQILRNHTYIQTTELLQNGTFASSGDYALTADAASTGWHKLRIVVSAARMVSYYLDNQLVRTSPSPIQSTLMSNKNVLLGYTSSGSAGKAYHDYVSVTYPLPD